MNQCQGQADEPPGRLWRAVQPHCSLRTAEDRALGRGEFLVGISRWVGKEGGRVSREHESLPAEHFPCDLI